ncbi:MAG: AsmA-like C-terminal region-containing protein [Flavobacteriaceae bacterium]|nr:AsmA-like C-terminal region-containing protein [Flavobacteriaceae bacterium]
MKKKILISAAVLFVVLIGSLVAIPYLFKDTIVAFIKKEVNKDLLATVDFDDVDITLFKSFPDATLQLKGVKIINNAPFEGDSLFYAEQINLDFGVKQLFKKEIKSLAVKDIAVNNAVVKLKVNADGISNWDITKPSTTPKTDEVSTFQMNINQYVIQNSSVFYLDEESGMELKIKGLQHQGKGDFTLSKADIQTNSTADELTFIMNKIPFINKATITLDALLGVDFDLMRFTFKDNKGLLNDLALVFEGAVQMNENDMDIDLNFKAPQADFKSLLSLVPSAYSENFAGVKASGKANVSGYFKGKYTDTSLPAFEVLIQTQQAQFQYPNLPMAVNNISFDGAVKNETGQLEATYLNINDFRFTINKDQFSAKGLVTNFINNPTVDGFFKGTINLANLSKAYPVPTTLPVKGILKADVNLKVDQQSITNNQFKNIKNSGTISLQDFEYKGDASPKPFFIKEAGLKFDMHTVELTKFAANTGQSDLSVSGRLDNFYAFLLEDKELKGVFNAQSNQFIIADFLKAETVVKSETPTPTTTFKIPKNLDLTANINVNKVQYDNITMKEVSGQLLVKDEKVTFTNTKAQLLGGAIAINGSVSTKTQPATFDMDLGIQNFDIGESFKVLETFQSIAPIAKALKGKINTSFALKGNLSEDMTPNLNSLSGNALAQLLVDQIDAEESKVLSLLGESQLNFLDVNKLNLKDLKTAITFADGKVTLKPITLKWNDISMQIMGSHGFDKTLNYNLQMELPAKYLGKEASQFLSKMTAEEQDKITVPLSTIISGSLSSIQIKPDMKGAMSALTQKMVSTQKDKFIGKGTDALSTLITGKKVEGTRDSVATTSKEAIKTTVNEAVKTKTDEVIKKTSQDLLKGILGKKTVKKDTAKN